MKTYPEGRRRTSYRTSTPDVTDRDRKPESHQIQCRLLAHGAVYRPTQGISWGLNPASLAAETIPSAWVCDSKILSLDTPDTSPSTTYVVEHPHLTLEPYRLVQIAFSHGLSLAPIIFHPSARTNRFKD